MGAPRESAPKTCLTYGHVKASEQAEAVGIMPMMYVSIVARRSGHVSLMGGASVATTAGAIDTLSSADCDLLTLHTGPAQEALHTPWASVTSEKQPRSAYGTPSTGR